MMHVTTLRMEGEAVSEEYEWMHLIVGVNLDSPSPTGCYYWPLPYWHRLTTCFHTSLPSPDRVLTRARASSLVPYMQPGAQVGASMPWPPPCVDGRLA